jgi:NADPH:quinone reductase-like Zn-dependent oxidoreductase
MRKRLKSRLIKLLLLIMVAAVAAYWFAGSAPPSAIGSGEFMRAVVYHDYGAPDVLRLEKIEKPLPGDNQVLIKVRAAGANPLDWHYMRGTPYILRVFEKALFKPKDTRLGVDVAGIVEAVGDNVTTFKPGDAVFGAGRGAFAEYVLASQDKVVLKPARLTFEQAAAVPIAALTALQGLRDKGRIQAGQKVLINGASGGVGTFAVQIARSFGADVTGVCSTRNADMVRAIGADRVIDYTREDFTRSGQQYDVILDMVGNHSLTDLRQVLTPKGILVQVGDSDTGNWIGPIFSVLKIVVVSSMVSQELVGLLASINEEDLLILQKMMEAQDVMPVIDRTFGLSEVPEAIAYLEEGHARGKVIITLQNDD